jgi:hypothetical protein
MPQQPERFRELTDHGLITAPSGAGALLLQAEHGHDCLLVLAVVRPADQAHLVAIVTFEQCLQSVFGYPNDEAYYHDPRSQSGDRPGYGFFEVIDSTWPTRLTAYNQHAFPDCTPEHYATLRRYFIGSHDASGEFLATTMKIELTTSTYTDAATEALRRITTPHR